MAVDVGNAYLNAPTSEKVYSIAGKEFGDLVAPSGFCFRSAKVRNQNGSRKWP
jgi:hypothetical protein